MPAGTPSPTTTAAISTKATASELKIAPARCAGGLDLLIRVSAAGRWPLDSCRRRVMHGHQTRLNSAAYSSIADWFALNSNELTWIALVTVGVIAVGMSM
jgi:hypothetical protein